MNVGQTEFHLVFKTRFIQQFKIIQNHENDKVNYGNIKSLCLILVIGSVLIHTCLENIFFN